MQLKAIKVRAKPKKQCDTAITVALANINTATANNPDYEALISVDEEIHCTLGKPTTYADDGGYVTHSYDLPFGVNGKK